jgi:glycosyltransferase involved in cell wall biosynthesis
MVTPMTGQRHDHPAAETEPALALPEEVRREVHVVVPAYNEGEAVGKVVAELVAVYPNVVVVDDGSTDDTARVAAAAGAVVLRQVINRGQGAAIQTGIDFALAHGAAYVVTFDSDGQHCVEDIAALVAPIQRSDWDISLGSRFLGGCEDIPATRRVLLKAGVLFTRIVSRVRISDTHNGLRAFSRRAAQRIEITLDRMAHASELIDQIRECGLPYGEVPVRIRYTDYSTAKGQRSAGAIKILIHYFMKRLTN